jgi:flagellar motor protein MotB
LVPAGLEDARPIADNSSDEARQKNRRVSVAKLY